MLQKELIRNGFVPLLLGYVEHNETNENLALMATNAIACLLDQGADLTIVTILR